jgi:prepilin-type N-terminal cleavage/methylation domain-containing protein
MMWTHQHAIRMWERLPAGHSDRQDAGPTRADSGRTRAHRAARPAGFSLLEVIIALALMISLMGGIYGFYVNTMGARDAAVRSMRDTLLMRALLEQISEEIRHITDVVPDNIGFSGTEEELTFVRLIMPDMGTAYVERRSIQDDPKPGQQDMARVTYKLQWDEEEENLDEDGTPVCYGLLRSQQTPIDPNPSFVLSPEEAAKYQEDSGFKLDENAEEAPPPVSAELIAPEVKYLRFEYFDGAEWRDRWQVVSEGQAEAGADAEGAEGIGGGSGSGADLGAGDPAGGAGLDLGSIPGGAVGGAEGGQQGYVLPQAIRITMGKVKVPRREDDFDISRMAEQDEIDKRTHHPDRWTMTVYLRQADQSQLSSRKYGIENSISSEGAQIGEQTTGGGR